MNHIDCKYYLATDVFNGICKRTKDTILADAPACEDFEKVAKCRHCVHYSEDDLYTGKCKNLTLAYPDMKAGTCADFTWN
ncbi:MAG: 4-hydroxyphenylacetate decarboxylase small subunit [Bacteroidetes bacterium]|nr:4-hydroxyphenylacetate decarboxylase small subunit [Bacteroidota bacterium]